MDSKTEKVFKFLAIPGPLGIAGALIWAAGYLLMKWDPARYPDFKTIFETLPWMVVFTGFTGFAVLVYYSYQALFWLRIRIVRVRASIQEKWRTPPPGMVLVQGGWCQYGVRRQKVHVGVFFIDECLVTNEQYLKFVEDTNHSTPDNWKDGHPPLGKSRHPVTMVNLDDAEAFCRWRSEKEHRTISLPSEKQWEKAARGPFGLKYPWGNRFDENRCNAGKGPKGDTNSVDAYPTGMSPYGCYDMVGNVWEWTGDFYDPDAGIAVLRGGSYYFDPEYAVTYLRYHDPRSVKWSDLGFRCVSY